MNNKLSTKEDFNVLFSTYYGKVVRFIVNIIKSEEVAADIAQDVFVKLWEGYDKIVTTGSVSSYIYTFARNATIDYLRSKRVERLYAEHQAAISTDLFDAEGHYDAREMHEKVHEVVFAMPERRREIFVMSRNEEMTNAEIAQKIGVNIKTVEYHISKALGEIRMIVRKNNYN